MKTIRFHLAGVQFRPAGTFTQAIADGLSVGSHLTLRPEPANKFDPGAIAVDHYGVHLGYVPKPMQSAVRGQTVARMDEFDLNDPPWERFPIIVDVVEDEIPGLAEPAPAPRAESAPVAETASLEIVAPSYSLDGVGATAAAIRERDELLNHSRRTLGVASADDAQSAVALMKEMTAFSRTIEATRETVKRPLIEAGRKIDAVAKSLVTDVEAEAKRLGGLLAGYQAAQKKIEEDNRRRAFEEQQRIVREAEERERKIREEREAARCALNDARNAAVHEVDPTVPPAAHLADMTDEQFVAHLAAVREARKARAKAEAAAAKAKTETARLAAEERLREQRAAEERRQREEAERAEQQRKDREAAEAKAEMDRLNQDALAAAKVAEVPTAPATKLTGIATGSDLKFEVEDIVALYEAAPYLVKLEPNKAAIKNALNQLGKDQRLPGVRHWREAKTVIR